MSVQLDPSHTLIDIYIQTFHVIALWESSCVSGLQFGFYHLCQRISVSVKQFGILDWRWRSATCFLHETLSILISLHQRLILINTDTTITICINTHMDSLIPLACWEILDNSNISRYFFCLKWSWILIMFTISDILYICIHWSQKLKIMNGIEKNNWTYGRARLPYITHSNLYTSTYLQTSVWGCYPTPLTPSFNIEFTYLSLLLLLFLFFFCLCLGLHFQCSLGTTLTSPYGFLSSSAQLLRFASLLFILWFLCK